MKTVLISIKPKWWDLILEGKKTVEVRKSGPKDIEYPFKVVCYVTGKGVVGQFMCEYISKRIHIQALRIFHSLHLKKYPNMRIIRTEEKRKARRTGMFTRGRYKPDPPSNMTKCSRLQRPDFQSRRKAGVTYRRSRKTKSLIPSMGKATVARMITHRKPSLIFIQKSSA